MSLPSYLAEPVFSPSFFCDLRVSRFSYFKTSEPAWFDLSSKPICLTHLSPLPLHSHPKLLLSLALDNPEVILSLHLSESLPEMCCRTKPRHSAAAYIPSWILMTPPIVLACPVSPCEAFPCLEQLPPLLPPCSPESQPPGPGQIVSPCCDFSSQKQYLFDLSNHVSAPPHTFPLPITLF